MVTARQGNSIALFALTSGGADLAGKLAHRLGGHLYLPERFRPKKRGRESLGETTFFFHGLQETVHSVFSLYRGFVFVMAAGIVVRTLAPVLSSKYKDPAVVVMDEKGSFAVSLVSGHVGGGNELTRRVAGITGGAAVITTATDVNKKPAVDLLASRLQCVPHPACMVKVFNRALVEDEAVRLISRWPVPPELTGGFEISSQPAPKGLNVIIDRELHPREERALLLLPRNLVLGIGCRRGITGELVIKAVENVLGLVFCGKTRAMMMATVDIKEEEEGIQQAAESLDLPLKIVSRREIRQLAGSYAESQFVKKTLGVGGVCEPAAMIASGRGRIIIPKQKIGPVTVAVAEEKLWWWDWAPETQNV